MSTEFTPLVSPAMFPQLAFLLLVAGIYFTGQFFVYEVTKPAATRSLSQEMVLGTVSALFLGLGVFFLALTVGLPV
eukprot:m.355762 g.355762  ORF g.355762 m.355762 type:complete len:76 (-) comp17332_c0_seq1:211-438(-)